MWLQTPVLNSSPYECNIQEACVEKVFYFKLSARYIFFIIIKLVCSYNANTLLFPNKLSVFTDVLNYRNKCPFVFVQLGKHCVQDWTGAKFQARNLTHHKPTKVF